MIMIGCKQVQVHKILVFFKDAKYSVVGSKRLSLSRGLAAIEQHLVDRQQVE